jgi:predicted TIM-barrel fold metal-dependent hydrolase
VSGTPPTPYQGRILDLDGHIMFGPEVFSELLGEELGRDVCAWVGALLDGITAEDRAEARRRAMEDVRAIRGFLALGADDPDDRLLALDALGIHRQLVLPPVSWPTLDDRRPAARTTRRRYNDWMAAWAKGRSRLVPVAQLALHDPGAALDDAEEIAAAGFRAVEVPFAAPPGDRSPAADAWDPVWALLAEARVAVVLHLGGAGAGTAVEPPRRFLPAAWYDAERLAPAPYPERFAMMRENAKAGPVGLATLHVPAEVFLSSLILGGTLERHPGLRFVVLEMGGQWISSWVERLDAIAAGYRMFGIEPLELMPSDVIRRQVRVAPFERNPVGAWIDRDGLDEVYAFASDYPHSEGGRDPIGRFNATLGDRGEAALERFFVQNASGILGPALERPEPPTAEAPEAERVEAGP